MLLNIRSIAAISLLVGTSLAVSQDVSNHPDLLDVESSENSTALERRGTPDCDFAEWQWLDVDCNYGFNGGNVLDYYITIQPTGQGPWNAWLKGIVDNIKGDCKVPEDRLTPIESRAFSSASLHHPKTHEIREAQGLFTHFAYLWPWTPGDDSRGCIESAIKKASCYGGITFKNGGCYKI